MSIRHKARLLAGALPVIAAAAVIAGAAGAADLKIIPKQQQAQQQQQPEGLLQRMFQALFNPQETETRQVAAPAPRTMQPPKQQTAQTRQPTAPKVARTLTSPPLVTGSINWPKSARATLSPATAGISYAHAAKSAFARARAAMDVGIMLLDDAPRNNTEALATATVNALSELEALQALPQNRSSDNIRQVMSLVQDWHRSGMRIINPPPQGLDKVPFPLTVSRKADAVAEGIDRLIGQADAFATAKLSTPPSVGAPGTAPAN